MSVLTKSAPDVNSVSAPAFSPTAGKALLDKSGASHHDAQHYLVKSKVTTPIGVVVADVNPKKHSVKVTNNISSVGKLTTSVSDFNNLECSLVRTIYKDKKHSVEAGATASLTELMGLKDKHLTKLGTLTYNYSGVSSTSLSTSFGLDNDKASTWKVSSSRPFKTPYKGVQLLLKAGLKGTFETPEGRLLSAGLFNPLGLQNYTTDLSLKHSKSTFTLSGGSKSVGANVIYVDPTYAYSTGAAVTYSLNKDSTNSPYKYFGFVSRMISRNNVVHAKLCNDRKLTLTAARQINIPFGSNTSSNSLRSSAKSSTTVGGVVSVSSSVQMAGGAKGEQFSLGKAGIKFDLSGDISEYVSDFFGKIY